MRSSIKCSWTLKRLLGLKTGADIPAFKIACHCGRSFLESELLEELGADGHTGHRDLHARVYRSARRTGYEAFFARVWASLFP